MHARFERHGQAESIQTSPILLVKICWKSHAEQVCTFLCLNGLYSHLIFIHFETEMFSLDALSL